MKKHFFRGCVVTVALAGLCLTGCCHVKQKQTCQIPPNVALVKQQIKAYYNSGSYQGDAQRIGDEAMTCLKSYSTTPGKLAMVFDIDDTLLLTWKEVKKSDFSYNSKEWNAWAEKANAPAIKPTFDLFNQGKKQGVAIFLITGRGDELRKATEKNLGKAGFSGWVKLYTKPKTAKGFAENYKTATRKKLTEQGYRIILNVGDQQSDLIGGYAEHTFKLPNPCYYIP